MLNLGFLASGRGSNVEAILNNIDRGFLKASPNVIITNNPQANVLRIAGKSGVPYFCVNDKSLHGFKNKDSAITEILQAYNIDLVVLGGYMKKLGDKTLESYQNKIVNIHPSLLPKYGGKGMYGMKVHEAVIKSNDEVTGVTIHLVNENYDEGRILKQTIVPRFENDTVDTLAYRVLEMEHIIYSCVLKEIDEGKIKI